MKKHLSILLLCIFISTPKAFAETSRLVMFVAVDVSGSFVNGKYFEDSLQFLAHYLKAHLSGYGGLDTPSALFVGSLGGNKKNEPKTLYPIQTFQNISEEEIFKKLTEIFPKGKSNPYTDYNAFFDHVNETVKDRKLILKPISILVLTDGNPDLPGVKGEAAYKKINLKPLELLSRNITLRMLYTTAITGKNWQSKVPRKRVRVWTQDGLVMESWKSPSILVPGKPLDQQNIFLNWIKDNVDFGVRVQRVD